MLDRAVQTVIWDFLYTRTAALFCSITALICMIWWRARGRTALQLEGSPETTCIELNADPVAGFSLNPLREIYDAAAKSKQQYYADRCMELIQIYPEYINVSFKESQSTPFLAACWAGNAALVKYMLQCGANIQTRTLAGESPFYLAAYCTAKKPKVWDPTLISLLYRAGCEVMARKKHGYNTLHLAASYGHVALARWLLLHGADPEQATVCGETPLDLAQRCGHTKLINLLALHIDDPTCSKRYLANTQ